ncbi:MAG: hypothetical protein IJ172_11985 [Ruminococcus sp.]|nr:hypothetical protein [Ruminococcus sp.]
MSDYIKEKGRANENELNALLERFKSDDAKMLCIYSNRFACTAYQQITDTAHLVEVRMFDAKGEFKAVRGNICGDFAWRYLSGQSDYMYSEIQYLDIDEKKTTSSDYVSIGGGHYEMPDKDYDRVEIKHYGEYDDNGIVTMTDYCIVRLLKKGELYNGL